MKKEQEERLRAKEDGLREAQRKHDENMKAV